MDGIALFIVGVIAVLLIALLIRWLRRSSTSVVSPQIAQPLSTDLEAAVKSLVADYKTIEAIKLVRQRTGMGLKEAKDAVDAMRRAPLQVVASSGATPHTNVEAEARTLLVQGNKIAAVKRVRDLTGWGLKEAKDYVDAL